MDEPVPVRRPEALQQHLPVVVQPDPMLDERGGTLRAIALSLGLLAVVLLVLYGMTRPEAPDQMASAPSAAAPAQPASGNAPAQKPEPSTTGQGQRDEQKSEGKAPRSESSDNAGRKNQTQQQAQ
jgi:hypothetical protein